MKKTSNEKDTSDTKQTSHSGRLRLRGFDQTQLVCCAQRSSGSTSVYMHRQICDNTSLEIDHKNGNGLDNRRRNLRQATHCENLRNQRKRSGSSSRFKGVSWYASRGKWSAYINNGPINERGHSKKRHLGYFVDEEEAARAYDAAAKASFGESASLNF